MAETWRCPTCLGVLVDHDARRCPTCRTRLRRRGSGPVVLGETSRLDQQATQPAGPSRTRLDRGYWTTEAPAPVVEVPWFDAEEEPELVSFPEPRSA